jgi:hypothetical protein
MSNNSKYSKEDLIRLLIANADADSEDKEQAGKFLLSEGINVDSMVSDGLMRIKKMKLEIEAQKTRDGMKGFEEVKGKISSWVDRLITDPAYTFSDLIRRENINVSFRSVESLSADDQREILINHFTLKRLEEGTQNNGV